MHRHTPQPDITDPAVEFYDLIEQLRVVLGGMYGKPNFTLAGELERAIDNHVNRRVFFERVTPKLITHGEHPRKMETAQDIAELFDSTEAPPRIPRKAAERRSKAKSKAEEPPRFPKSGTANLQTWWWVLRKNWRCMECEKTGGDCGVCAYRHDIKSVLCGECAAKLEVGVKVSKKLLTQNPQLLLGARNSCI